MPIQLPWAVARKSPYRNANDEWKNRWRSWVSISTVAGAIVHLLIFIVIPAWEITRQPSPDPLQFIQFDPLMAMGSDLDSGVEAVAAAPDLDNLEIDVAEGAQGEDAFSDEAEARLTTLMELFGAPEPSLRVPRTPREDAADLRRRPLPPLELEEVSVLAPRLVTVGPPVQLPVIRNPTVLQRYLRTRYNPLHRDGSDGSGHVSVAMWINERGAVEWTAISQSSGFAAVDEIALGAFTDVALFTPARSEGARVPVSVVISVPFTAPW